MILCKLIADLICKSCRRVKSFLQRDVCPRNKKYLLTLLTNIMMKNKSLLSLLLLGLLFATAGCKKDNDDDDLTCGERLEGDWRAYSFEIDGTQLLGYNGQGGINFFEMEFSDFNPGNNNGELRVTFQFFGEVPSPPITGLFSPGTDCNKLDTPDFLNGASSTVRWDIISLDDSRLIIEANAGGFSYEIKMDKI